MTQTFNDDLEQDNIDNTVFNPYASGIFLGVFWPPADKPLCRIFIAPGNAGTV